MIWPTLGGIGVFAILGALHVQYFRTLFSEDRIPGRFVILLLGISVFWNAWTWISGTLTSGFEILLGLGIIAFFGALVTHSIGVAYAKYLTVLSGFFLFQGKVPFFFLTCIATIFLFVVIDILRFNLRTLFSKGPFFALFPRHVVKEGQKILSNFQLPKVLSYVAVFFLILFFVRSAQSFLSTSVFSRISWGNFSLAVFSAACMFLISWGAFRFARPIFVRPGASVPFIALSGMAIAFWHAVAPVPFGSTVRLFISTLLPFAFILAVGRLLHFYSDIMGTELVDYRKLRVGDTIDTKYLFSVWYDYQPGNDRIVEALKSLKNPIDAWSKKRISQFFKTCLSEAEKKSLQGFHPRFDVRVFRPISIIPILVPTFFACFAYFQFFP